MSILLRVWAGSSFTGPVEVFEGAHHAVAANSTKEKQRRLACWPRCDPRFRGSSPTGSLFLAGPSSLNIRPAPLCNYNPVHCLACHQVEHGLSRAGLPFPGGPEPRGTVKTGFHVIP